MRQVRPPRRLLGVLLLGLLAVAGCGPRSPTAMNQAVLAASQRLFSVGKEFGVAVGDALRSGQDADVERARKAYKGLAAEVDKAVTEVDKWSVSGVDGAEQFQIAAQRFFKGQKTVVDSDFKSVVEILEKKGVGQAERVKQVQEVFQTAAKREQQDLGELQKAQMNFAQKHGMTVQAVGAQ